MEAVECADLVPPGARVRFTAVTEAGGWWQSGWVTLGGDDAVRVSLEEELR